MKIAICDDDLVMCSVIERFILDIAKRRNEKITVEVFTTGSGLCDYLLQDTGIDLIFLDIEMPHLGGIEVGRKIREDLQNQTVQIVYISGASEHAMSLFPVRPQNFLIKPISHQAIENEILKCKDLSGKISKCFVYSIGHETYKCQIRDILYFESVGRKIRMVTRNNEVEFNGILKEVAEQLQQQDFINCHKSFLVNYYHITEFDYEQLVMTNGDKIPIAQLRRKEVRSFQKNMEKS